MISREILKKFRRIGLRTNHIVLGAMWGPLLLCSCTTTKQQSSNAVVVASELPPEVIMNHDAGRGNWLFVTLRLESGEELPFFIDTGAATFFDKSLAPKLGKPLGTAGVKHQSRGYAAPRLFLGNTQLMTGDSVWLRDLTPESSYAGRKVMGVLGIDCLKHYCIQLDFEAGRIRFLDPEHLETASLGKAFPLAPSGDWARPFLQNGSLVEGEGNHTLIDSGYDADGALNPEQFAVAIRNGKLTPISGKAGWARLPNRVWNGETHTNLLIGGDWNVIGLRFLARHLVTFDFPKWMMYLKQTSTGPLVDEKLEAALNCLHGLKERNQLPGWLKGEKGTMRLAERPDGQTVQFIGRKSDGSSNYHYIVVRTSDDSPWQLQKAWRTDQNNKTTEEYLVP